MGPSVSQRKYKLKFFRRMATFDVRKDCNAKNEEGRRNTCGLRSLWGWLTYNHVCSTGDTI
tara:strand:+ start:193 stop:375 length:183 start_codon:yes stop_codon:yes gene_type:complete